MNKVLSFCLLAVLPLLTFGQTTILSNSFPDADLVDAAVCEDGYVVIGHTQYEEQVGQEIFRYYDGFVKKLDVNLQPVWQQDFPRSKHQTMESVAVSDGKVWVLRTHYPNIKSGKAEAKIHIFSNAGREETSKSIQYPGYYTTEAEWLQPLPDGTVLAMTRAFRTENGYGTLWLHKVDAQGNRIWAETFGKNAHYADLPDVTLTASGTVVMTGLSYATQSDLMNENSKGWLVEIRPDNPKKYLHDRTYTQLPNLVLGASVEGGQANLYTVATQIDPKDPARKMKAVFLELDDKRSLVQQQVFDAPFHSRFNSICWNPRTQSLYLLGSVNTKKRSSKRKKRFVEMSLDGQLLQDLSPTEAPYQRAFSFSNGQVFAVTLHGVEILE